MPALHEVRSGYRVKTTVPVGLSPPLTVAESLTATGTVPPALAVVAMLGPACEVLTGSSPHLLETLALLASPL